MSSPQTWTKEVPKGTCMKTTFKAHWQGSNQNEDTTMHVTVNKVHIQQHIHGIFTMNKIGQCSKSVSAFMKHKDACDNYTYVLKILKFGLGGHRINFNLFLKLYFLHYCRMLLYQKSRLPISERVKHYVHFWTDLSKQAVLKHTTKIHKEAESAQRPCEFCEKAAKELKTKNEEGV